MKSRVKDNSKDTLDRKSVPLLHAKVAYIGEIKYSWAKTAVFDASIKFDGECEEVKNNSKAFE